MARSKIKKLITILFANVLIFTQIMPVFAMTVNTDNGASYDATVDPHESTSNEWANIDSNIQTDSGQQAYNNILSTIRDNDWWNEDCMDEVHSTHTTKTWIKQGIDGNEYYNLFNEWINSFDGGRKVTNYESLDDLEHYTPVGENPISIEPINRMRRDNSELTEDEEEWAIENNMLDEDGNWNWQFKNGNDRLIDTLNENGEDPDDYNIKISASPYEVPGNTIAKNPAWYEHFQNADLSWLQPKYTPVAINYANSQSSANEILGVLSESDNYNLTAIRNECLTDMISRDYVITNYNSEYMWYIYNNTTGECVGCYFTNVPNLTITFPKGDSNNYTIEKYQSYNMQETVTYKYKIRNYLFTDETLTCLCMNESEKTERVPLGVPSKQWELRESESLTTWAGYHQNNTITLGNSTTPFNTQQIK